MTCQAARFWSMINVNNYKCINELVVSGAQSIAIRSKKIRLRASAEVCTKSERDAKFSSSLGGKQFKAIGSSGLLGNSFHFIDGYLSALFNDATQKPGGAVAIRNFHLATPWSFAN